MGAVSRFSGQTRRQDGRLLDDGDDVGVDLARDVALEDADDLFLGATLFGAPLDVGDRARIGAHPGDHDVPQRLRWLGGSRRG